jgi:hypothetical protein
MIIISAAKLHFFRQRAFGFPEKKRFIKRLIRKLAGLGKSPYLCTVL